MRRRRVVLVCGAIFLLVALLVVLGVFALMLSLGGSVRGAGYSTYSVLELVTLMAVAFGLALLLARVIRALRQGRLRRL